MKEKKEEEKEKESHFLEACLVKQVKQYIFCKVNQSVKVMKYHGSHDMVNRGKLFLLGLPPPSFMRYLQDTVIPAQPVQILRVGESHI